MLPLANFSVKVPFYQSKVFHLLFMSEFSVVSYPDLAFRFTRRTKGDGPRKQRPMSEGTFNFSSFLNARATEEKAGMRQARLASLGADPWGAGRDLPSLLQQVSFKNRRESDGAFSDNMASLSRRRVDLFSSLRIRKREASESEGKDQEAQKEIKTILTNLRNKG